ncbi:DUF1638 domain-containing protein [Geomesophilobacter sediminis]|uniref:DUF1638 domain-containing protein n=1 Tax=Geomesophilobacter sediminis TaxID=2798584 RepID=A0A8J7ISN8_9BACT|nr:DUF1638 domain-containing protein [Geomesophilobacter sediminis]MBJ6726349.1 DUF1638 domain-containing protein [Geomesophilobacter sediminis]
MSCGTVWLCCGVLRNEMEELVRRGKIGGELLFLDSMLHMDPLKLEERVAAALERLCETSDTIVLVYGDCGAHLLDLVRKYRIGRVPVINCAQLLVGRARYRRLMQEGAFLVLPEWALRWEQIMKSELGLNRSVAQDLMGEHRGVLVYLDTGIVQVPQRQLQAFSSYTGLPWRVEAVDLDVMLESLLAARAESLTENSAREQI